MLKLFRGKKGQNTAEYAIVISLVVAALIAMRQYVVRGLQGKVQVAVDNFSAAGIASGQFEPGYLTSSYEVSRGSAINEQYEKGSAGKAGIEATKRATGGYQQYNYTPSNGTNGTGG